MSILPLTTDEVYQERLEICNACPLANHFGLIIQCSVCKCEMHIKARLSRQVEGCPHPDGPKWSR